MTYDEILAEVLDITKRPDKTTTSIPSAIQAATLKAHHSGLYFKDLVEVAIEFDTARLIQTFYPKSVVPKYRQAKYMRIWIGGLDGYATHFLDYINIENALDSYGYLKTNVFYLAGNYLQIRATSELEKILFGCYVHPTIAPTDDYASWVAEEYPWAIIYEASRVIFSSVGYKEKAAEMRALVAEQYGILTISNVDTIPT